MLVACRTAPAATSPTPAPPATETATPTPTASPTPLPTATRPGIVVSAAGRLPADHAFVLTQNTGAERVLLLDLAAKKSYEVVRFDRPASSPRSVVMSDSAGTEVVAVLERSGATTLLHIVFAATGRLRTLPQPEGVDGPQTSPDGSVVAVTRKSPDPALSGVWLIPTDGSAARRIVAAAPNNDTPQPVAWSSDGRWLAYFRPIQGGPPQVVAIDTRSTGGDARELSGIDAVWVGDHRVVTWINRAQAGELPTVRRYDTNTRTTAILFTAGADETIQDAVAVGTTSQGEPRLAVVTAPFSNLTPTTPRSVILVDPGQPPRILRQFSFLVRVWWSADGQHLYVRGGGDDSVGGVTDVLGTWGSMPFCLRGGDPPSCL